MKETEIIIHAFKEAQAARKRVALATVVKVEGSSYRRPGARMLVTEDGVITGAISGGCLEGDALRKAQAAIMQNENKLVVYDSTDEDDARFGVQLGCNGIVYILFEPIDALKKNNAIFLLEELIRERADAVLVTMFSPGGGMQPGTVMLCKDRYLSSALPDDLTQKIFPAVNRALQHKYSEVNIYDIEEKEIHAFIEFIPPPIRLIIAGAGNDVVPLTKIATIVGWEIVVADGRPAHATQKRFPKADRLIISNADELTSKTDADAYTAFLLMTHNYKYDIALLAQLRHIECGYIGILGPKQKTQRMLQELADAGIHFTNQQLRVVHGPTGLDIGAETPAEIAVSIIAEVQAFFADRAGASLKTITQTIHGRMAVDQ